MQQPVRAAELVGALSLATDLGTGQPLEHALRTAVLAVRLGELAGASPEELADTYYVALLHASGCTSNGHEATQLFGEDIEHRAAFFLIDPADPEQVIAFYRAHVGPGRPPEVREQMIEAALSEPGEGARVVRGDVRGGAAVRRVARPRPGRRGGARVRLRALGRPGPADGRRRRGAPAAAASAPRGEGLLALPLRRRAATTRVPSSSVAPARRTSRGSPSSPLRHFDDALSRARRDADVGARARERAVSAASASRRRDRCRLRRRRRADEPQVAVAARALDRRGRARRGGRLAPAASRRRPSRFLRRAALAHDLGRVGVSNAIWEKPGPLGFGEWERVRLHPHFTERAFAQSRGARADRTPGRLPPRAARRVRLPPRPARVGARHGGAQSSPPPTATRRCARRGRTGRRSSPRPQRRS